MNKKKKKYIYFYMPAESYGLKPYYCCAAELYPWLYTSPWLKGVVF